MSQASWIRRVLSGSAHWHVGASVNEWQPPSDKAANLDSECGGTYQTVSMTILLVQARVKCKCPLAIVMKTLLGCTNENTPVVAIGQPQARFAYSPFGYCREPPGLSGHNGELCEGILSTYALGNGYRHFSPTLQSFYRADNLSPFTVLNSYAFCAGDPVNWSDPSGHMPLSALAKAMAIRKARRRIGRFKMKVAEVDKRTLRGVQVEFEENIRSRAINLLHRYLGVHWPEIEAFNLEKFLYQATSPKLQAENLEHGVRLHRKFVHSINVLKIDPVLRYEYMDPLKEIYIKRRSSFRDGDTYAFDMYTGRPPQIPRR